MPGAPQPPAIAGSLNPRRTAHSAPKCTAPGDQPSNPNGRPCPPRKHTCVWVQVLAERRQRHDGSPFRAWGRKRRELPPGLE
eukprot:5396736-Pyramimonas_sp.AAC.1